MVTFVLIGKRKGASVAIGPNRRYRFVNGEMTVKDADAGKLAVALSHYAVYPKGDAEPKHLAACEKLGIDPVTLKPVTDEDDTQGSLDFEPADDTPLTGEALWHAIHGIVKGVDHDDDNCWTDSGLVSVKWVNAQLPGGEGASRKLIDEHNVVRESDEEDT